jgi:hypothetical protein
MLGRCRNPNDPYYHLYGGSGIEVEIASFEEFFEHVGPRPSPKHSIDRIDNNGNYAIGNIRWATQTEQNNNKRNNRLITVRGRTRTMARWSHEIGVHRALIQGRLRRGWSPEKAVLTPPLSHSQRARSRARLPDGTWGPQRHVGEQLVMI